MLTVYGDIRSGNCLKVKWMLDRLGRDYRWIETDVMSGVTRSTGFLAVNPCGQVPAVVLEDGRALSQSNAIIGWLQDLSPLRILRPAGNSFPPFPSCPPTKATARCTIG